MHLADLQEKLKAIGNMADDAIPLAETLLMMGALERESADLQPYRERIAAMITFLRDYVEKNPKSSEVEELEWRVSCLNVILCNTFGSDVPNDEAEDPDEINFLNVLDGRKDIPVGMGALFLVLAEEMGWNAAGLSFPGRFLVRMEQGSRRLIVDPFEGGKIMQANDLRHLLKNRLGEKAELHHHYYDPVTKREVVLRFYNNRRMRLLMQEDYTRALQAITHQFWIAPKESRLYYDAGVICARMGRHTEALEYLQEFVELSGDQRSIAEAESLMASLRRIL